jgi:hypothetical protein
MKNLLNLTRIVLSVVLISNVLFIQNLLSQEQKKTQSEIQMQKANFLSPSGVYITEEEMSGLNSDGTRSANNYIMGNSGQAFNNTLILNGVAVPSYNAGWYDFNGWHIKSLRNYLCGLLVSNNIDNYYRNFHAFNLSNLGNYGITLPITTAILKVQQYESNPSTGEILWVLHSVTSDYSLINNNYNSGSAIGINIYNDLGTGTEYGNVIVDRTQPISNMLEITLNSASIAAINAAASTGSIYVIGGVTQEVTSSVPLANWAIIIGIFLIVSFFVFKYKREIA